MTMYGNGLQYKAGCDWQYAPCSIPSLRMETVHILMHGETGNMPQVQHHNYGLLGALDELEWWVGASRVLLAVCSWLYPQGTDHLVVWYCGSRPLLEHQG